MNEDEKTKKMKKKAFTILRTSNEDIEDYDDDDDDDEYQLLNEKRPALRQEEVWKNV